MSVNDNFPKWWPTTLLADTINTYLSLTSLSDSRNLLDNFKSKKRSFFSLAEPLVQKFDTSSVTQQDSYFIGQDQGQLTVVGDIANEYSAQMIWTAAVAIQRKLTPHLLAVVKDSSYKPDTEAKAIRLAFSVLNARLVFLRTHVLGQRSCPLIVKSIVAACQRLSRVVHHLGLHRPSLPYSRRPIPIPLNKDCRETAWLGEQDPVDNRIPGAPGPVSDGEEEEGNSNVPSESERLAYEAPPSHSRASPVTGESSRYPTRRTKTRKAKRTSPAPLPKAVPKKLKKIPAPKVIPKASKEVKTPIVSKNSRTPKASLEAQELKSSKGKILVMETKAAGPSKGKTKTKNIKGKGKEVVPDSVVPPSLKRKRLNDTEDEAEASTLPTPTLAPKLKTSKKLVPVVEIPVPMASGSKGKVTVPLESSCEPTPAPAPPENLVFLVPDEDVDSLDLDGLFQDLASRSLKEFVASGSTEYRTVIVHFKRDALDLPSFEEILPPGNQKPKELFKTRLTWGITPELDAFLDLPAVSTGTHQMSWRVFLHANRALCNTDVVAREIPCLQCAAHRPADSKGEDRLPCTYRLDDNGSRRFGASCDNCAISHQMCSDTLHIPEVVEVLNETYEASKGSRVNIAKQVNTIARYLGIHV
ncbi:hypothetical protein BDP27DRAFT_1424566 [Rhodocollybia butyracea]|uniref:Uncharacterized protein n=1 Tax=Rhodocollybia butyracea TaxID=206335 RepID=A0A9P5PLS1_9AGAR|nr:hypothetical protein BDP27DRAFT_1424566 [Rhodocollybia butyracea]